MARIPSRLFGTLKLRLMLASALVIGVSVATTTEVVLQRVEARSVQAVMELERDNAERMAAMLGQRVVSMQKMLRATAAGLPIPARHETPAAIEFLNDKQALLTAFATIYIASREGALLALHDGSSAAARTLGLSDRDYFQRTLAQGIPVVSLPMAGRVSQEPVIQLTMPVLGEGGAVEAVIGGTLRLSSRNLFDDLTYAGHSQTDRAITIVTDARGVIISHPDRSRVMQPIAQEPGLARLVAHWEAGGRPVEPTGLAVHERGHFVTMAGVAGADWMVFHVAPDTELLGGLQEARREAIQWAAGVALLGSLLILGLLALLLGPLSKLRRRAQGLAQGGLPIDQGWPRAQGEIGELSRVLQQVLRERAAGEEAQRVLAQQMQSLLAAAPVGIALTRGPRFEFVGAEFCALLGWPAEELVGRPALDLFASPLVESEGGVEPKGALALDQPFVGELQLVRRDGSRFWGRLQGRPVESADSGAGTIWLLEDVTEHRAKRERLSWSATHDALTGLLNRGAFEARLDEWLKDPARSTAGPQHASLLYIDLDRFKQVNDRAGHAAGDEVLRRVGAILRSQLRADDVVARLGGDEFALLLPGCVAAVARQLAERLRHAVADWGVDHPEGRLTVDASVGVVEVVAAQPLGVAEWLARADAACYAAKREGRGVVRVAGHVDGRRAEAF